MNIPNYPDFIDINLELKDIIAPHFRELPDGISEFTFAGLYLFRNTYKYRISLLSEEMCVISGEKEGKKFFMLPCGFPEKEQFDHLFQTHDFVKCLPERYTDEAWINLEGWGYKVEEDRNNFDYLYKREDLATLAGRKYHKKRNLVNAFINNYQYEERPLTSKSMCDAFEVLEKWRADREDDGDYKAAKEALELCSELKLKGAIYYVDGKPAGYTLGEPLAKGKSFVIHFEKALNNFKGIYQFINKSFAAALPKHYVYINREQDLGDPGLRQAKKTYRPCGFIKKYRVEKH